MSGITRSLRLLSAAVAIVFVVAGAQNAYAVKANPKPVTYYQPDGTPFEAKMIGDERVVFVEDSEGHTVVRDESTGWYVYADPASHKTEKLLPSKYKPGKEKAPKSFQKHVRPALDAARLPGPPFVQQDDGSVAEALPATTRTNPAATAASTSARRRSTSPRPPSRSW